VKRREPRLSDLDETPDVASQSALSPERVDAVLDAAEQWLAGHPRPRVMRSDRPWELSDGYRAWQREFSVFLDAEGLPFLNWQVAASRRASRAQARPIVGTIPLDSDREAEQAREGR
jgi:hypothetical protein